MRIQMNKPRIGILALMQGLYDKSQPEIPAEQSAFVQKVMCRLDEAADYLMVHPDCQYTPKLLVPMASMIAEGLHPCVIASRILGGYALRGGMPLWKYVNNRWLTAAMNLLTGAKLSEYHTGYRAFSAELLRKLPLERNTDDFAFDAQMLMEVLAAGGTIGEVSCPTVYTPEASSIGFARSCRYGAGCLAAALRYRFARGTLR